MSFIIFILMISPVFFLTHKINKALNQNKKKLSDQQVFEKIQNDLNSIQESLNKIKSSNEDIEGQIRYIDQYKKDRR